MNVGRMHGRNSRSENATDGASEVSSSGLSDEGCLVFCHFWSCKKFLGEEGHFFDERSEKYILDRAVYDTSTSKSFSYHVQASRA